jgi:cation transport protein ChaC
VNASRDFWVFAYGSLIWRPGFAYVEREAALLHGYHRALCVYSHVYRGTPERPGLVAGLLSGGACRGVAYRVAAADKSDVIAYLDDREMIYGVYVPTWLAVNVGGETRRAYGYVANRGHQQFAGKLGVEETARLIVGGNGVSGSGREYLENTVTHLGEFGIHDRALAKVLARVRDMQDVR